MNLESATNEQLWNIVKEDNHVPKELMGPIVVECINRQLFDHLIHHLIKKVFPRTQEMLFKMNLSIKDLFQIGNEAIYRSLPNYKEVGNVFFTFAYVNVNSQFIKMLRAVNAEKREVYKHIVSLDKPSHEDNDEDERYKIIDHHQNVERQALFNVEWEEAMSKLNDRERQIIHYLLQGYSLNEMARDIFHIKGAASVHRQLHRAFQKINPDVPKIKLHEIGIVTQPKGGSRRKAV